eukprot:11267749-Prorocentrum_lima.AAC.1
MRFTLARCWTAVRLQHFWAYARSKARTGSSTPELDNTRCTCDNPNDIEIQIRSGALTTHVIQ